MDTVRWGQYGLAVLTATGRLYLMRGAGVLPQLLKADEPATLEANSLSAVPVGSGNVMLTLTGTNLLPGIGVFWNGAYRTTTIVDATHVTVAFLQAI